ncbi:hypothetical protein NDU88_007672 [Pleurodeles waltl]|uniref:Uncharacterized protein n=1 Tax=Pleurodeles waltl TaxID=8319 RepID=A0AAV7RVG0_PLEWA|nr:hypothetical protein NDU88_007672 [Pleurodeles waltl]
MRIRAQRQETRNGTTVVVSNRSVLLLLHKPAEDTVRLGGQTYSPRSGRDENGSAQAGATSKNLGRGRSNLLDERRLPSTTRGTDRTRPRLRESATKEMKSRGRNTAERLRGKRELNAYLRSAAGETNVQKNVRFGPRGASAPIIYAQIK